MVLLVRGSVVLVVLNERKDGEEDANDKAEDDASLVRVLAVKGVRCASHKSTGW